MNVFAFDPNEYRDHYLEHGFVHIKNGIAPEFLELLRSFAAESLEATQLEGFEIKGKKEQSLYEFPPTVDYGELFDVIATMCGLNRPTMTLSERHIQAYEPNAAPEPLAHKDRFASQVSVGFSIDIPAESKLVLYPWDERGVNPFNTSRTFHTALQPHERPERLREHARELVLDDEPGDLVAFPGSTTWHLRRNAARSVNLYLKFNDFDCDPLGEDPTTGERRERTVEFLSGSANGAFGELVPVVGRRFDLVSRHTTRLGDEVVQATVWGEEPFPLNDLQERILRTVDGRRRIDDLGAELPGNGSVIADEVRVLAERGALDLLASETAAGIYGPPLAATAARG